MKILVFSDLHYYAGDMETAIFNKKRKLVRYALPMLDRLTEVANEEYLPDIVVNLGDIIQDTTEREGDLFALRFMYDRLKRINAPCYSVLGNHDLKMMDSIEEVEKIMGHKSSYSLDYDGWHLVFLTNEVRAELGTERGGCYKTQYIGKATLEWLKADLDSSDLPSLVFTHFGVAEDSEITDGCMFMKNREDLKDILVSHGRVKAVFSGHQHIVRQHREGGIDYYVFGSMINSSGTEDPDGCYAVIETEAEKLAVKNLSFTKEELRL